MSVRSRTSRKPLAFFTSLMVLFALVFPLIGTAGAGHAGSDDLVVAVTPPSAGAVNACVEVVANLSLRTSPSTPGEGETIDISIQGQDTDQTRDLSVAFCDPDGTGPATDLTGPPPNPLSGQQTGGGAPPAAQDCDDDGASGAGLTGRVEGACANVAGAESPAIAHEECITDAQGNCRFGVTMNEAGTLALTVFFEECVPIGCVINNTRAGNEPFDTENVTFSGGGAAANLTCTPGTDSNPDGTRHEWLCTVTDSNGAPLPGVIVSFTVQAGPNSQEVIRRNCGSAANNSAAAGGGGPGTPTNNQGQTAAVTPDAATGGVTPPGNAAACGYTDTAPDPNSLPGTDTIVAYVNLGPQPGGGAPTNGPDAGEPQVTLTKIFTSFARNIDCEPENQTIGAGSVANIVCTVTDNTGTPLQGVQVTLHQTGGAAVRAVNAAGCAPAPAIPGAPGACGTTNAAGQAPFSVSSRDDTVGAASFRGQIAGPGQAAGGPVNQTSHTGNCQNPAGTPAGAAAGNCNDDVGVNIIQSTATVPPPPPAQCNDGIDNDGDNLIDFGNAPTNDPGCVSINDNTESPNPQVGDKPRRIPSTVTAPRRSTNKKVTGSVSAGKARCEKRRRVKIRERGKGVIAKGRTSKGGNYNIRVGKGQKRLRAIVGKKRIRRPNKARDLLCRKDKSPFVRV